MIYIGVDPGVNGGIAVVSEAGAVLEAHKMPETEQDLLRIFTGLKGWARVLGRLGRDPRAVLELVYSSPQMGVVSAFTFGQGVGRLTMALTAAQIPFDQVSPYKWQQVMQCRSGGDKNVTKRRAQQLFPTVKVTHAIADALLLAEYCRRVNAGHLPPAQKETESNGKSETQDRSAKGDTEGARAGEGQDLEAFVGRGQAAQRAVDAALEAATQPGAARVRRAAPGRPGQRLRGNRG